MKRLLFLLTAMLLTAGPLTAAAEAQQVPSMDIRAGLDSFTKTDTWGPLRVTLANQGSDLKAEIRVQDSSYWNSDTIYSYPVDLPGQSRKQVEFYIPLRGSGQLTVNLLDEAGRPLLTQQVNLQALNQNDFLVGVVASDPSLLNGLAGLTAPGNGRVGVAHLTPDELPATLQGWTALDMLVFNDIDTGQLTPAQREALTHWVSLGGRLVVGGGPQAAQTIAGLSPLLPFSQVDLQTLPHPLPALAEYGRATLEDRGPYVAAIPVAPGGEVVLYEQGLPVIVSGERDLGRVHYLAFDLSLAPMDTLSGRPRFFPRLVDQFVPANHHFTENVNRGEVRSSLTLIPDQTLPSPRTVVLYLAAYILVIGPLNYIALGRLKRREWAWFSLPLIILLFCGFGYFSGFRLRGGEPLLRQITVLHSHTSTPLAEATSFIGVYSPNRTSYTLEMTDTALVSRLSGETLSGEMTVMSGNSTTISNLQADIGGMPTIVAHTQTAAPQITARLIYETQGKRVRGTVINNTGQPISHAHLVFENASLAVGSLPPGETRVDGSLATRNAYTKFYDVNNPNLEPKEAIDLVSRDIAVKAILNFNNYQGGRSNITGLYLVGWQAGSPVRVNLAGQNSDQLEDTLLLVGLPYTSQ